MQRVDFAWLAVAAAALACTAAAPATNEAVNAAIVELASPVSQVRDAAMTALAAAGPGAAEAVRRAAVDAPPAAAAAAARAWSRLRWRAAGCSGWAEVAPLLGSFGDPATRTAWEAFIARHGAETIRVVAGLADTAGQQENVPRAMAMLLSAVPAPDVARSIADESRVAVRSAMRDLLVESAARIPDSTILGRTCEVLLLLWWYEDVPGVAVRAWRGSQDEAFIRFAAAAVRRGSLQPSIGISIRALVSGRDRSTRGTELVFWTRLARETGAAESIRGCLRPSDLERLSGTEADAIAGDWIAMGMAADLDALLDRATFPVWIYLRACARAARGQKDAAVEGTESAIARLLAGDGLRQQEAFDLAEIMERRGDAVSADRVWAAIVERPPTNTVHDANALLRLARRAESRGEFRAALDLCEKALEIGRDLGGGSAVTGPGGSRGTEWLMRAVLDLKRKASAAESPPAP